MRCRIVLSVALSLALGACASDPARDFESVAPSSPVRGADNGLEVLSWVVDDSTGSVGRTLAGFPSPAELPASEGALWQRAGFRLIALPQERLEELRASLHPVGGLSRQWFGLLPRWAPVIKGPSWTGERTIGAERMGPEIATAPDERLVLGPGRLRLLARCWDEPLLEPSGDGGGSVTAVLHLELVPQHEEATQPARRLTLAVGGAPGPEEQGLMFRRLAIALPARRATVYLIVPEAPGVEWRPVEESSSDQPGIPVPPGGPDRRLPPSLGEAMLTDAPASGYARNRLVLVLIPRVPESFELLPEPPSR